MNEATRKRIATLKALKVKHEKMIAQLQELETQYAELSDLESIEALMDTVPEYGEIPDREHAKMLKKMDEVSINYIF